MDIGMWVARAGYNPSVSKKVSLAEAWSSLEQGALAYLGPGKIEFTRLAGSTILENDHLALKCFDGEGQAVDLDMCVEQPWTFPYAGSEFVESPFPHVRFQRSFWGALAGRTTGMRLSAGSSPVLYAEKLAPADAETAFWDIFSSQVGLRLDHPYEGVPRSAIGKFYSVKYDGMIITMGTAPSGLIVQARFDGRKSGSQFKIIGTDSEGGFFDATWGLNMDFCNHSAADLGFMGGDTLVMRFNRDDRRGMVRYVARLTSYSAQSSLSGR